MPWREKGRIDTDGHLTSVTNATEDTSAKYLVASSLLACYSRRLPQRNACKGTCWESRSPVPRLIQTSIKTFRLLHANIICVGVHDEKSGRQFDTNESATAIRFITMAPDDYISVLQGDSVTSVGDGIQLTYDYAMEGSPSLRGSVRSPECSECMNLSFKPTFDRSEAIACAGNVIKIAGEDIEALANWVEAAIVALACQTKAQEEEDYTKYTREMWKKKYWETTDRVSVYTPLSFVKCI